MFVQMSSSPQQLGTAVPCLEKWGGFMLDGVLLKVELLQEIGSWLPARPV